MPALRQTCGLILLSIVVFVLLKIFTFGSSAPVQKRADCRCSLSCDGAPKDMKQRKSVHVLVEHRSDTVLDKTFSSLYEKGRCSVPGCFERETRYTLKIYTNDNEQVPTLLYDKTDVQPECDTEKPPEERIDVPSPDGADRNSSNTLLILMIICCFVF